MGAKTLLYVEETLSDGDKDAQLFVTFDHGVYRVYFTRFAPCKHSTVAVSRLAFKRTTSVLRFLKSMLSKDSSFITSFYSIDHYDDMMNFNDLWALTGDNRELAGYDEDHLCLKTFKRYLLVLKTTRMEETFTWSATKNAWDDEDDDE